MKKLALRALLFMTGFTGAAACCKGQSPAEKTMNSPAACAHCGKTSCDRNCTSGKAKKASVMQNKTLPSCTLNEGAFAARADTLSKTIFSKAKKITHFRDGYDIVFNEPKAFSAELMEMVNFERTCCAGFTWALVFEPANKVTHLQVYGSAQIKKEMGQAFRSFGLSHLIK